MTPKATILYIEDDIKSQKLIQRVLVHAGYNVLLASRALEGIDMARQHQPDLVLTDINLPDLSGREITVRLRMESQLENVPIIAVTAQSHAFERDKTIAAGVSGYLTKPVNIKTLTQTVAQYLEGHTDTVDRSKLQDAQRAYNQDLVKQLEQNVRDLEARNRDLKRVDRLKDDFIQLTAHELRTPLTTVYGYARLVETAPAIVQLMQQSPDVNATLTGLIDSIKRLHSVVDEIVVVSRIASGRVDLKPSRTQLKQLLDELLKDYGSIITQRNITIEHTPDDWDVSFFADRDLLALALSNLFGNAIKYTPDGGRVSLHIDHQPDDSIRVGIRDSGIGIEPAEQQYIFDGFYTAGDTQLHSTSKTAFRGGGLGLGLAICRGIVEAHNGTIWVESSGCDPEKMPGSTFYIKLPLEPVPGNEIA